MKELSIEQKAKAYNEAIKVIKDNLEALNEIIETGAEVVNIQAIKNCFYRAFPELKEESEDEMIIKWIIDDIRYNMNNEPLNNSEYKKKAEKAITWLEKQGKQYYTDEHIETNAPTAYGKYVDECLNEASKHFLSEGEDKYSIADLFYAGIRCGQSWLEKQGKKSQDASYSKFDFNDVLALQCCLETVKKVQEDTELYEKLNQLHSKVYDAYRLEKQGEQKQLYIRFGDIPANEKSKIYRGEEEIGTENGVSVYPAFKTDEGDIVLGLNLPITKTTLHTQQHLIEYDNRPCYLVKGNYVGKDTDGQPLINNVSIIEKIGSYRAKEEKQDEQKSTDNVKPKFNIGDWIVDNCGNVWEIKGILNQFYILEDVEGGESRPTIEWVDKTFHLWTIEDTKEGDIVVNKTDGVIGIFQSIGHHPDGGSYNDPSYGFLHCRYDDGFFYADFENGNTIESDDIAPATKEQCDLLFAKMKEAGYEWNSDKKELKKIENRPLLSDFFNAEYERGKADALKCVEWSEEDEDMCHKATAVINKLCAENKEYVWSINTLKKVFSWLKSIKQRLTNT